MSSAGVFFLNTLSTMSAPGSLALKVASFEPSSPDHSFGGRPLLHTRQNLSKLFAYLRNLVPGTWLPGVATSSYILHGKHVV